MYQGRFSAAHPNDKYDGHSQRPKPSFVARAILSFIAAAPTPGPLTEPCTQQQWGSSSEGEGTGLQTHHTSMNHAYSV